LAVRRDLFRENGFGVLGLPFGATSSEIRQRAQQRLVELDLAGAPRSDQERVRQALHVLEDPRSRLLEEIYWVHLIPDPIPADFSPRETPQFSRIATALQARVQEGSEEALHDLALLRMAAAEDQRSSGAGW
jgi:hypothetical protein